MDEDELEEKRKIMLAQKYKDENTKVVYLPPMIKNISECKNGCFNKEVCSIAAIALEPEIDREYPAGTF